MTELDRVARSLEQVRAELSPAPADKARLRALLVTPPPAAGDGGVGSGAAAHTARGAAALGAAALARAPLLPWVALRATGKWGLALGALLLGAGVAIGFWWGSERALRSPEGSPNAPPVELARPLVQSASNRASAGPVSDAVDPAPAPRLEAAVEAAPIATAASAPSAPGARAMTPRATPRHERAPSGARPRSAALAPGTGRERELMLLRRVERAIRSGEPVLALGLLAELDEAFPETTLDEERLAARRLAECRAGKPDSSASARRFLLEHATSVYRQRIELACGLADRASEGAPMQNLQGADTHVR